MNKMQLRRGYHIQKLRTLTNDQIYIKMPEINLAGQ